MIAVATYIHRINRQLHRSVAEARLAAVENKLDALGRALRD
mgnify:CR=1 FL=1